ncbi:MAG: DNA translocase FtsK 4TM domain-containing protein [Ignavibacteriales bacterium]|nr:DNA translocase FtsK 4TM domain-containing protein [Ignavibacteriales bacterium]
MNPQQKRQIGSFVGILVSFMLLLSLVSYTSADQANGEIRITDLWKVFTNDEVMMVKALHTKNWLGLMGAILSNWLINSTVGYAILALPFLGLAWSWRLLRQKNSHKLIVATNYVIVLALIFASFTGTLRQFDNSLPMEWSGAVGDFGAVVMSKLVGLTGTLLILFGLFVVVLTLMVDLDYQRTFERVGGAVKSLSAGAREKVAEIRERRSEAKALRSRTVEIRKSQEESVALPLPLKKVPPTRREPLRPPEPLRIEKTDEAVDDELPLDIKETIQEEEVDFDERSKADDAEEEIDYVAPSVELLDASRSSEEVNEDELKINAEVLRAKLADFDVAIESVSVTPGPVVTLYEVVPAAGVKISRIESLEDDIALALKAKGIRIIAPIPGKGTVGVEIPNHNPSLVTIRSIINSARFRDTTAALPLAMGKTITGEVYVDDLSRMPHLLIAGSTGSGKSVGINTILTSLIYRLHPSGVKFVIIDPKKIELSLFQKLNRHYLAVSPDIGEEIITSPNNAVLALKSVELEMEKRYDRLAAAGVRNIADYNDRVKEGRLSDTEAMKHRNMPYLIIIIDELADLMITAAREVEEPIARLAQLARAVGIHLVLATQRPSVDVITGVIKANFPARIAYQVSSKTDSRTILDMNGAEQLLGNGDMLYLPPGSPKPIRIQNAFISTQEVERITNHIGKQKGYVNPTKLPSAFEKKRSAAIGGDGSRDELFEEAARIVVRHQQGSVSILQRRLQVGYSRAARIIDQLEEAGIVGPFDGSKAREVMIESEAELEAVLKSLA